MWVKAPVLLSDKLKEYDHDHSILC